MLPSRWRTPRLIVDDVTPADLQMLLQGLDETADIAALDPAFGPAPPAEVEALIARSGAAFAPGAREFQMQVLRVAETGDVAGYWHFVAVPRHVGVVGVSILLVRPAFRRRGLGQELIAGAAPLLAGVKQAIWARVYLGNPRAIEFWAQQGFRSLALHADTYVLTPDDRPSIILAKPLPAALRIRPAVPDDAAACVALRGRNRENAVPAEHLAAIGITPESWAEDIRCGRLPGHVGLAPDGTLGGYGFGDVRTGEVVVLALLPAFEGQGVGRALLARVVQELRAAGHTRLFLGCARDPSTRSHGFYRRLGWQPTGQIDANDDEILELWR